jgi:hypothetical protein
MPASVLLRPPGAHEVVAADLPNLDRRAETGYRPARRSARMAPFNHQEVFMRKFIIEREIPGIGGADQGAMREAAVKSNGVLDALGQDIQWIESYVTGDKIFCVYLAKDETYIRKHAEKSGFPANRVTEVKRMIDPTTARA